MIFAKKNVILRRKKIKDRFLPIINNLNRKENDKSSN